MCSLHCCDLLYALSLYLCIDCFCCDGLSLVAHHTELYICVSACVPAIACVLYYVPACHILSLRALFCACVHYSEPACSISPLRKSLRACLWIIDCIETYESIWCLWRCDFTLYLKFFWTCVTLLFWIFTNPCYTNYYSYMKYICNIHEFYINWAQWSDTKAAVDV